MRGMITICGLAGILLLVIVLLSGCSEEQTISSGLSNPNGELITENIITENIITENIITENIITENVKTYENSTDYWD